MRVNRKALVTIGVGVFLLLVGVMTSMMLSGRRNRVEVCMEFRGQTACKIAAGPTSEDALRAAGDAACALIASGMTDTMECSHSRPLSVRWLK